MQQVLRCGTIWCHYNDGFISRDIIVEEYLRDWHADSVNYAFFFSKRGTCNWLFVSIAIQEKGYKSFDENDSFFLANLISKFNNIYTFPQKLLGYLCRYVWFYMPLQTLQQQGRVRGLNLVTTVINGLHKLIGTFSLLADWDIVHATYVTPVGQMLQIIQDLILFSNTTELIWNDFDTRHSCISVNKTTTSSGINHSWLVGLRIL